jgi:hypothetical protein
VLAAGVLTPCLAAFGQSAPPMPILAGPTPVYMPSSTSGANFETNTSLSATELGAQTLNTQSQVSAQLAASVGLNNGGCCACAAPGCNHCCPSHCGCGCCLHQSGGFGEVLYLTPRGIDLAYAVPQDGIGGIGTVPVGPVGVLNYDYDSGFRGGFNLALDCYSSITATFTWYETDTNDSIGIPAPNVIQPLVLFPGTFNAGFTAQEAFASQSLEFQLADLDYRAVWKSGKNYHLNYLVGARYGHLDQTFQATFPFAPPDGVSFVATDINFDGAGIRFGLDGERCVLPCAGLRVYGKAAGSLLAGEVRSAYTQVNQFNGLEVLTSWDEDRVVPIVEFEAGLSWTNRCGSIRASAGYYFATWSNIVTTPEYINAVQGNSYIDVAQDDEDTITFDGLVGRLEFRL